ncbi:MAG: hypothetical protein PHX78_05195 [bacterium]|nr:hypothetical protein [bacterium]
MAQTQEGTKAQAVLPRISKAQVTGPERYRLFQTITVIFTVFGSTAGTVYLSELKAGIIGGLTGLFISFILIKLLMGDNKNIFRRNFAERTLDSAISMLGAGIFSGVMGGLFGYYLEGDFNLALSIALTCVIAGVVSTSLAGLAVMFWEVITKKKV